jgi:hypothetical protein
MTTDWSHNELSAIKPHLYDLSTILRWHPYVSATDREVWVAVLKYKLYGDEPETERAYEPDVFAQLSRSVATSGHPQRIAVLLTILRLHGFWPYEIDETDYAGRNSPFLDALLGIFLRVSDLSDLPSLRAVLQIVTGRKDDVEFSLVQNIFDVASSRSDGCVSWFLTAYGVPPAAVPIFKQGLSRGLPLVTLLEICCQKTLMHLLEACVRRRVPEPRPLAPSTLRKVADVLAQSDALHPEEKLAIFARLIAPRPTESDGEPDEPRDDPENIEVVEEGGQPRSAESSAKRTKWDDGPGNWLAQHHAEFADKKGRHDWPELSREINARFGTSYTPKQVKQRVMNEQRC